ncbi:MAG: hypothetical protein ACI3Z5_01050 [Paludibacteraceae bacterium]
MKNKYTLPPPEDISLRDDNDPAVKLCVAVRRIERSLLEATLSISVAVPPFTTTLRGRLLVAPQNTFKVAPDDGIMIGVAKSNW